MICFRIILVTVVLVTISVDFSLSFDYGPQGSYCLCPVVEKPSLQKTCGNHQDFMTFVEVILSTQCSLRDPLLCYKPDKVKCLKQTPARAFI